jgi:deoxyribodipyrimidine photo-lyase
MKRSLVWFKTDLRLHDNEVLVEAISQSDEIVPVYCFDDKHFETNDFEFKKTGKFRAQFLIESLIDLDNNLRALGSGLVIVKGIPEVELIQVATLFNATKVFAKKEVAFEELIAQHKVEQELLKIECSLETFSTSTMYSKADFPFQLETMPNVFTDFRKIVEGKSFIRDIFLPPENIHSPEIPFYPIPYLTDLGLNEFKPDCRAAFNFKGGETEGKKRVNNYFFETHSISTYKMTRNELIGENYSSKFSPWLALGCLSPRFVYAEIKNYEKGNVSNESTYWVIFELLWRDFFAFMMEKYPTEFFKKKGINNTISTTNTHQIDLFKKWQDGQTENDFINANMMELNLTGFMSNRGRQNVASYLCHDMKLDWRYGAAYFEEQLIDYDVSSNWGNWAYIAGVGNNPRGVSVFNVNKQANDYDKNKSYRNLWLKHTE